MSSCVRSLCWDEHKEILIKLGVKEVIGVHYDRFHSVYMNPELLKCQYILLNRLSYRQ